MTAILATATNVFINYATTEASAFRWGAVVLLTVLSGLLASVLASKREPLPARAPDKPAVHLRIADTAKTIDFKIYSEEVALRPGYINQWIRTAHDPGSEVEPSEGNES
ncbi:hypothetical protein GCM10023085_39020 [Actinomadura viridis]